MNEEAQPSLEPEVAASEPTLDDVISEFDISQSNYEAPVEPTTEPQYTPQTDIDPYDPNSVKQFVDGKTNALQQKLSQMESQFTALQQERIEAKTNADIKQAVGALTKTVEGLNPDMAEAFLEMKARKDGNFREIWNNRDTKPQALDKAMQVLANEARTALNIQSYPQLVENQRAMKQSMQTNSTNAPEYSNEWEQRLEEAESFEERERIRNQMMGG